MNWQLITLQFVTHDLGKSNWTFWVGNEGNPDFFFSMNRWVCISVHGRSVIITQQLAIFNSAYIHQIWPSDLFSCNRYMYAFKSVGMQSFFKAASCNIKYSFKASVLTPVVYVHCCFMFWKMVNESQLDMSDSERETDGSTWHLWSISALITLA